MRGVLASRNIGNLGLLRIRRRRDLKPELLGHRHTVVFSPVLTNAATRDAIDIEVHKRDRLLMERNAAGCAGVETAPGGTNGDQVALSDHDVDDDLALFKLGAHRAGLGQLGKDDSEWTAFTLSTP